MKHCRSLFTHLGSLSLVVLAASACSPVGNGTGPVSLTLNDPNGVAGATSTRLFQCIRGQFSSILLFSDGSSADFAQRARWTSSNPAVLRVSNGDEPAPAPATGFFPPGVFTPVAPGTTTVTVDYLGLTDSIDVSVGTPTDIRVREINLQTGLLFDPPGNAFRIGIGTSAGLAVTALLDNVETIISGAATFAFDPPPSNAPSNDTIATISSVSGIIGGVGTGGPLVARASFAPCSLTATTSVSVAPITGITIVPEFTSPNLFVGNSEVFRVMGDFGSGPEQDVSLQAVLTSSNTAAAVFSGAGGVFNQLSALAAASPITIGATFTRGTTTPVTVTAPTLTVSTVTGTLESIAVTPATASVVAGSDQVAQYNVIGTYTGGTTQDVTRRATWVSSDNTIGQILATALQAGQARSAGRTPGTTTFTATVAGATVSTTATATLTTTAAPPAP